jgi:hypothetical protein
MTELKWDDVGERYFETGIDRGVFYKTDGVGIAWNGLISVTETPSGGEATQYYLDGVMYQNIADLEEFSGTIEAFTYPNEFAEYDGSVLIGGLIASQQRRKPFGLAYRTRLGNDVDGIEHGYKIHLIYNALAAPTEKPYETLNEEIEPLNFSWEFTTKPIIVSSSLNLTPLAHVVIDSTKTTALQMQFIEDYLYGTADQPPRLLSLQQVFDIFENTTVAMIIDADLTGGLSSLFISETMEGDLFGAPDVGLYSTITGSRLVEQSTSGLYIIVTPGQYLLGP